MVGESTRLQFVEALTYPTNGKGDASSALSSLPSGSRRNFFHLGLYNPHLDVEGGEVASSPLPLLSPREIGDGVRVAFRPLAHADALQFEFFAEENTQTLKQKEVFGAAIGGARPGDFLETWRIATLSKRRDEGPQGRDWDTLGFGTGWKLSDAFPLRAEVSGAAGKNEGGSGVAGAVGLHYNRTLVGEKDASPLKMGAEFALGDKGFPGAQNGREDRRAYFSYRLSENPTFVEAYANYNDSKYSVIPKIEKTLEEQQSLVPEFLLTSQSRLISGGLRWRNLSQKGTSYLPPGQIELQETRSFNRSDFFDRSEEKAVALTLQPFSQPRPVGSGLFQLDLQLRGGVEDHQEDGRPSEKSPFITLGGNCQYSFPAPRWIEQLAGPTAIRLEVSPRYTQNFEHDPRALNRTGFAGTATASLQGSDWSARLASTYYTYEAGSASARLSAAIERKVAKNWWAGIEAAFTERGGGSGGNTGSEGAVMLTFRHDFEIPVPWMPKQGQATGRIFDDANNNGRMDPGETGLGGIKVGVGKEQTLTAADGSFTLPPMSEGEYPVTITPPEEVHYGSSGTTPTDKLALKKGEVTAVAIGLIKPTTCEGTVQLAPSTPDEIAAAAISGEQKPSDLSGLEIIATDANGRRQRGFTRADGFFAMYLDPGTYELAIDSRTLTAPRTVSPQHLTLKVERNAIQGLAFTVTDHPRKIRKTFTAQNP